MYTLDGISLIDPPHSIQSTPCEWCGAPWVGNCLTHTDDCAFIAALERLDAEQCAIERTVIETERQRRLNWREEVQELRSLATREHDAA